jgi:Heterokaryon incompatibility protein (HET)
MVLGPVISKPYRVKGASETGSSFKSHAQSKAVAINCSIQTSLVIEARQDPLYHPPCVSRSKMRLLSILDASGDTTTCELHRMSLSSLPQFTALSYVWGDPAAFHLRADALRINQNNDKEKSSQVQLMGTIFQSAALFIAWLGTEDEMITLAFDTLEMVYDGLWKVLQSDFWGETEKSCPLVCHFYLPKERADIDRYTILSARRPLVDVLGSACGTPPPCHLGLTASCKR